MNTPIRPEAIGSLPKPKRFINGDPVAEQRHYEVDLKVHLANGELHHHLGSAAPSSRQFTVRYEIGAAGELTVWSLGFDMGNEAAGKVKRAITYGPTGWVSLSGPALPIASTPPTPRAMLS